MCDNDKKGSAIFTVLQLISIEFLIVACSEMNK